MNIRQELNALQERIQVRYATDKRNSELETLDDLICEWYSGAATAAAESAMQVQLLINRLERGEVAL